MAVIVQHLKPFRYPVVSLVIATHAAEKELLSLPLAYPALCAGGFTVRGMNGSAQ